MILTGAFLSLVSGAEFAYPVFPLKDLPAMNGKWDGKAWSDIPTAIGFTSVKTGSFVQLRQTSFKMGWHGNNLYIAIKCDEPEPDKIKTDENNYRDGWYPDDNLEFFFSAGKLSNKGVKQFVTNSRGARWCNFAAPANAEPWATVAVKGTDNWSAEIRIPFAQLGIGDNFKDGKFWFNLARTANSNQENDKWSCFAPVKNGFSDAANFADLNFKGTPTPEQLDLARKELNRLDKWVKSKLWTIANVKETFLADRKDDENIGAFIELKLKAKQILSDKKLSGASELINEYDKQAGEFSAPSKKVVLQSEKRDATMKLYLDGKEIKPDASGKYQVKLKEGLSVLAAECSASGSAPAVKLSIEGLPETASRWKLSAKDEKNWMDVKFSDEKWVFPATKNGGFMWSSKPEDSKIYMRQIILWESKPFGKFLCINPPVKEWLFSENSTETLFLSLYPLLPFAPENYEFVLDIPEGFELLDLNQPPSKSWHGGSLKINAVPKSVKKEEVKRDGSNYLRYRIAFDKQDIPKDMTFFSMLPVKLKKWSSENKQTSFYFHRMSDGNFTELEQTLPVGILPPVNGRVLKRIMISQYCGSPYFGAALSERHMDELVKDSVSAGLNYWMVNLAWSSKYKNLLVDSGAKLILGHQFHPLWGCKDNKDNLFQTLKNKPETRAQYFNNTKVWDKDGMYCPSWAVGEGREQFKNDVRDDYALYLKKYPMKTDLIWANWEGFPWVKSDGWSTAQKGDESYCFCARCKKEFVKYAGLPEGTVLSDDDIFKKHYKKWFNFRSGLDGKIQGAVRDALVEIGKKYMVYSQTQQREFWEACKGNADYIFLGCPGNGVADSKQQEFMDVTMKFFEDKVGMRQIIGQRFVFFGPFYAVGKNGPQRFQVMSRDGILNARTWKSQVLRATASFHGGVDMQSSVECVAGILYYVGEATRAIAQYEELFYEGIREDSMAFSAQIKYPNILVLTKGDERLILLFNEGDKPLDVELENKGLKPGQTATIWEKNGKVDNPEKMKVTILPEDVTLIHIK